MSIILGLFWFVSVVSVVQLFLAMKLWKPDLVKLQKVIAITTKEFLENEGLRIRENCDYMVKRGRQNINTELSCVIIGFLCVADLCSQLISVFTTPLQVPSFMLTIYRSHVTNMVY